MVLETDIMCESSLMSSKTSSIRSYLAVRRSLGLISSNYLSRFIISLLDFLNLKSSWLLKVIELVIDAMQSFFYFEVMYEKSLARSGCPSSSNILINWSWLLTTKSFETFSLVCWHGESGKQESPGNKYFFSNSLICCS